MPSRTRGTCTKLNGNNYIHADVPKSTNGHFGSCSDGNFRQAAPIKSGLMHGQRLSPAFTVPLIYNFTFTRVYTHGITQYLASKNPCFIVEKFFSTTRIVESRVAFHDMSLGIFTTHVIFIRREFPRNEPWNLHETCMTMVIHTVIRQTNPPEILLSL